MENIQRKIEELAACGLAEFKNEIFRTTGQSTDPPVPEYEALFYAISQMIMIHCDGDDK